MFITSAQMGHQMASALVPGHQVWNLVQLPLANPLVIVRIARLSRRTGEVDNTYVCETGYFAAMAHAPKARVLGADLLLPPQVSPSAHWEAHQVLELWECEEPHDTEIHCCILRTAQFDHSDSVCGTSAADLKKRKLLYRLKSEGAQPQEQSPS